MRKRPPTTRLGILVLLGTLVPIAQTLGASPAGAATSDVVYSYTLDGSSATVPNAAAVNTDVPLHLLGDWSASPDGYGVFFDGDLVSKQSAGEAEPAYRPTLSVAADDALAFGIRFRYHAPASGAACRTDSANLLQIGRAGDDTGQAKLQLSRCGTDPGATFVECRIAGDTSTVSAVTPVRDTLALENGGDYIARCLKVPDDSGRGPAIVLKVIRLAPDGSNVSSIHRFPVAPIGPLTSTQYLSVGNKYKLVPQESNTDQFVGDVKKVAFCRAGSAGQARACLDTEITP